jgi:protein TIF31
VGFKADKKHAGPGEAAKKPEEPHISDDASAEAQLADSEQATYASANNDLKGTKAYQEADISGLYNLAMTIIDYRGHRVVAQVCTENVFWYIALSVFLFEHALHISFFHS